MLLAGTGANSAASVPASVVAFDRPLYLMRAADALLVACSLDELLELVDCEDDAGDPIEFVRAYYGADMSLDHPELERIARIPDHDVAPPRRERPPTLMPVARLAVESRVVV